MAARKKQETIEFEAIKKNEVVANKQCAIGNVIIGAAIAIVHILFLLKVFDLRSYNLFNYILPFLVVILIIPIFFIKSKYVESSLYKYFILISDIFVVGAINTVVPKHAILAWCLPVITACHYYSPRTSRFVFFNCAVVMAAAIPLSMLYGEWDANLMGINDTNFSQLIILYPEHPLPNLGVDVNDVTDRLYFLNHFSYYSNSMNRWLSAYINYYIPRMLILGIAFYLSYSLNKRTHLLFINEAASQAEKGKLQAELNVASEIQLSALPQHFPNDEKVDVYALTDPAKEVGGDFYNVFVFKNHMYCTVADVSGKGVPAALFMMKTNTLLCSMLKNSLEVDSALRYTNKELCIFNERGMFVTAIVGCLDIATGVWTSANAGHNPPLVRHKGGKFKYHKLPKGFVLGGFEDSQYKSESVQLSEGDTIFAYTDGVTEAMNEKGELYGEERLLNFLNTLPEDFSSEQICLALKEELISFANGAEQSDDVTMFCMRYVNKAKKFSFSVPINKENVTIVQNFVNDFLKQQEVSPKIISQFDIVIDEICSNIFNYAYADKEGQVDIEIKYFNKKVTLIFVDKGEMFNPLEKEDPDINLKLEERKIGGLGIYIVKQLMDEVEYEYTSENENKLTVRKIIGD